MRTAVIVVVRPRGPLFAVICSHSLEHPELEFSGPSPGDWLAASPGFINAIGVLFPMAPWGRTSL